ncbi:MAG: MerR family transcriptional regulator [Salinivirgaceae bacterium]|nr:MerR family transcriptional regulator [Salinivirgaceae bacterium]MDD4747720.1 MerR family transcriptional regulator [Salinivirgaceae bacterium]MDY0279510.1 MerR family transcriptional regulator [Salinivirgaceae bacterium]
MSRYSIKDLEQLTGIKAHTIRIWEKRYNIVSPERTDTNIRYYNDMQLKRLLNVSLLNKNGFKISKLASMSNDELCKAIDNLDSGLSNQALQIEHLISAMVSIDEVSFNQTITKSMVKNGFEYTLFNLIYPFFDRVGLLWLTGVINPAREHFVSSIIKQKIYTAYDKIITPIAKDAPVAILSLHENEFHEITLLISNYIARKLGFKTIYLGQSVPYESLADVLQYTKSNLLITNFVTAQDGKFIESYLQKIATDFPKLTVLAGGFQIANQSLTLPSNVMKTQSAEELKENLTHIYNSKS